MVATDTVEWRLGRGGLIKKVVSEVSAQLQCSRRCIVCIQRFCNSWRARQYTPDAAHGRQAHEVVFILRRMVEQATERQIPIFVMDCDVAAVFDHVSHHVITDAMEALKVPPVLVAAWIREYGV